jgi:multicomponent Na+:H+ antiporter subunit D
VLSKDLSFNALDPNTLAGAFILFAFAIKAGFPLVNFWLAGAYPKASPSGTVFLSIFTTKLGIYALVRGFAGLEWLIYIGMVMAIVPALFALAENNLRRVLAYGLNSQLGFMVAGIGIGTALALNGAIAHAFASVIYQALLFMIVGASILYGKLNRFYLGLCLIGAASIAGLPLFIGFTTKSLTIAAALSENYIYLWLVLLAANAMAVVHTSIRVPFLLFFNDSKEAQTQPPKHIFIAPALAAVICIGIGVYPQMLYALLPFEMTYTPFSFAHVLQQLELIAFASFGGLLLFKTQKSIVLELDWLARGLPYLLYHEFKENIAQTKLKIILTRERLKLSALSGLRSLFQQNGYFASVQPTGFMVLWLAILLIAVMVFALII